MAVLTSVVKVPSPNGADFLPTIVVGNDNVVVWTDDGSRRWVDGISLFPGANCMLDANSRVNPSYCSGSI